MSERPSYGFPEPPDHDPAPPASAAEAPRPPGWGPGRAVGGLFVALVLILVAASVAVAVEPGLDALEAVLALQAAVAAIFVAVAFFLARPGSGAAAPAELGLRRPLRPAIKASVLAYLVYIACALAITAVLDPEQEDIARELGLGEGVLGSLAAGFLIIGVASMTEEIFFRGFVFAGLRRGMPFVVAALISAFVWALLHFNPDNPEGSWGVVVQLTVLGVALAWLYERTGSIWPPIAIHALNNALAFAVLAS